MEVQQCRRTLFMSHATFVIILWCLLEHGSHTPFCMCMYTQNLTIYRLP